MKLKHDRQIVISVGKSRKDMNWLPQTMTVSELYARFDNPVRGVETLVNYLKLKKSQQDDLKDVGGFVGGSLSGGRRKASAVTGRDLITLDFDTIPAYGAPAILSTLDGLGCSYLVYSTRKHCETAPRLRILMPLDRTVTAEEYEAIARRIASMIGIQMADPTTFEPSRLMYWPSCCADSEYIRSFEGKEASELLQGVWLVEVAELDAFRKTDVSRIKQFLSLTADRYRAAYGRHVKELPRCCVFFGTSNQMDFLQDTTGNRRFWPVDVGIRSPELSVFKDMDGPIIDQIWAEAKAHWLMGEPLFLSGRLEQIARQRQEDHRDASAQEGAIQDFVQRKVPADWSKWSIDRRRDFWAGGVQGSVQLVNRDRISAIEVWCELFNKPLNDCKRSDAREINSILANIPGWKRRKMRVGASYGAVQAYVREESDL